MSDSSVVASLLERARATRDDLAARLLVAAAVERVARTLGLDAVVVGGTAVDFYVSGAAGTSESYPLKWRPSGDIDMVVVRTRGSAGGRALLARTLADSYGFRSDLRVPDADGREIFGRGFTIPNLRYGVEIVGEGLESDPRAERVYTVEIAGERVILEGPEDIVLHYAESGWETRHARDWERALAVREALRDEIDEDYVREKAAERQLGVIIEDVLSGRPLPERRAPP